MKLFKLYIVVGLALMPSALAAETKPALGQLSQSQISSGAWRCLVSEDRNSLSGPETPQKPQAPAQAKGGSGAIYGG